MFRHAHVVCLVSCVNPVVVLNIYIKSYYVPKVN